MLDIVSLLLGIALAAIGGELFVRGSVTLAHRLRVPTGIIGATVAAFATSSPELSVGVNAALNGTPAVSAGDVLGSNVANVAMVMGAMLVFSPVQLDRRDVRRDLPLTILSPLIVWGLLWDGRLSRTDGFVLLVIFAAWLTTAILQAKREHDRSAVDLASATPSAWSVPFTVLGLALLLLSGRLVVIAAGGIGETLHLDPFVVGATLVALGTSVPELATAILSRLRGHGELGSGTVMGSNIFNTLWIVGLVAVIRPFELPAAEVGVAVLASALTAALLIPVRGLQLGRARGVALLLAYAVYVSAILLAQP